MLALTSNNEIIHIKNALIKTNYFCADCNGVLRVKNGKIKAKHFYHLSNDCGGTGESLIHKYWKQHFSEIKNFEGYEIIDSKQEVKLLNGSYIPDIILKTNENKYLIIEICYKNPKDDSYFDKFLKLKNLEKVYEIKVDFSDILNIKKIFDRSLFLNLEKKKKYLLDNFYNGALLFTDYIGGPTYINFILHKKMKSKRSYKKIEIFLEQTINGLTIKTTPFYYNVYNEKDIGERYDGLLGYIEPKNSLNLTYVYLTNKKYNVFKR